MKRLSFLTRLLPIICLLLLTIGCGKDDDENDGLVGGRLAAYFSVTIADENGTNLLDPLNPDNIIDRVEMEVVCADGKIIPVRWSYDGESTLPIAGPGFSTDNPTHFDYDADGSRLIVGYWIGDAYWETSFKIKIPSYGIELNVNGSQKPSPSEQYVQTWQVDDVNCGRSYTLILPDKQQKAFGN